MFSVLKNFFIGETVSGLQIETRFLLFCISYPFMEWRRTSFRIPALSNIKIVHTHSAPTQMILARQDGARPPLAHLTTITDAALVRTECHTIGRASRIHTPV